MIDVEEKTPAGTVFVRTLDFLAVIGETYAAARAKGRPYLEYEEWRVVAVTAIRSNLIRSEDLKGDFPGLDRFVGMPFVKSRAGIEPAADLWRTAILKTLRRVVESKDAGISAEQHYRDQLAVMNHDVERAAERDRAQVEARKASAPRRFSRPKAGL